MPTLKIFDFDDPVANEKTQLYYNLLKNIRQGAANYLQHDSNNYVAIVTLNSEPEIVLCHLLKQLQSDKPTRFVRIPHTTHELTLYYFNKNPVPLIIATVDPDLSGVDRLAQHIKLEQITSIIGKLPYCDFYHAYSYDENNLSQLTKANEHFSCHLINPNAELFTLLRSEWRQDIRPMMQSISVYRNSLLCINRTVELQAVNHFLATLAGAANILRKEEVSLLQGCVEGALDKFLPLDTIKEPVSNTTNASLHRG